MANLIPGEARKNVVREYRARVATVWMVLIAFVCIGIVALMIPTYLLIDSQERALEKRMKGKESTQVAFDEAKRQIDEANALARHIETTNSSSTFVGLMGEIDTIAGTETKIKRFDFVRSGGASTLTIEGVSSDRVALAAFKDALAARPVFTNVDLPLSSLAQDKNIAFTMEIVVETP